MLSIFFKHICEQNRTAKHPATSFPAPWGEHCGTRLPTEIVGIASVVDLIRIWPDPKLFAS